MPARIEEEIASYPLFIRIFLPKKIRSQNYWVVLKKTEKIEKNRKKGMYSFKNAPFNHPAEMAESYTEYSSAWIPDLNTTNQGSPITEGFVPFRGGAKPVNEPLMYPFCRIPTDNKKTAESLDSQIL